MIKKLITNNIFYLFIFISLLQARSNTIDSLQVSAVIHQDGTVSISEKRVFNYEGSYNYTYLKIKKKLFKEIYDIRVFDGDIEYLNSNNSEPNTYQIQDRKKSIRIKWFHYAKDTQKEFTIFYKLKGALRIGVDETQFHWTYLGNEWDVKTRNLIIKQNFENKLLIDDIWFRLTGLSDERIKSNIDGKTITLSLGIVPKKRNIRVNTIFPTDYLNNPIVNDSSFTKKHELEKIKNNQVGSEYGIATVVLFFIITVTYFIFMFIDYGKEYKISDFELDNQFRLPSEHHPAIVSYFVTYQKIAGVSILATLFKLSNQNYFTIQEKEIFKKSFFRKKDILEKKIVVQMADVSKVDLLDEWDMLLAKFIILEIKNGSYYLDEIFQKIGASNSFMSGWKKLIDQHISNNAWIEKPPKNIAIKYFIIHFLMFSITMYFLKYNPALSIMSGVLFFIVGLIGAFGIKKMSYNCRLLKKKWDDFGKKIRSKKNFKNYKIDNNILLQYGVAVGLDNHHIKQLLKGFNYSSDDFFWFSNGNINEFTSMVDASMGLGTGFGGDGGAGGGGGGAGGGGGGGSG